MKQVFILSFSFLTISLFYGCQKEEVAGIPILTTTAITNITEVSMTSGGNILSDGGAMVLERGICWSTNSNPEISDEKTSDGAGEGTFSSSIHSLAKDTKYYVAAYAISSAGTGYGNRVSFVTNYRPTSNIFNPYLTYGSISDIDGNSYKTIQIGTQTWSAENLKTTKYNDGTSIPIVTDNGAWDALITPAYCWYNNDEATYKPDYGALYNKYASNSDKLCPTGWHVPSFEEWKVLCSYVQSFDNKLIVSTGMLQETGFTHWAGTTMGATNESGFTALPGGIRALWADGTAYRNINLEASWWNSSPPRSIDNSYSWVSLGYKNPIIGIFGSVASVENKSEAVGMSIRCLKN